MASLSPIPSNTKAGEPMITTTAINGSSTPQASISLDTPKTNQRGHNKPKCIKCGNVARSRCPFQSCKNCCAKAQNPCHIHVLKQSSILPAQTPPPASTTPVPEQPAPDVPSTGNHQSSSWRLSSLKRYSNHVHMMRTKKPLTRKDTVNINKHRFAKLKEHIEGNIEAENEAFDRYMWNVALLEETFSTNSLMAEDNTAPEQEKFHKLVSSMKINLMTNDEKTNLYRERTRNLIDRLLEKLQETGIVSDELDACNESKRHKKGVGQAERTAKFNDLIDKLSKARTEDDLKLCLELKHNLLSSSESKITNQTKQDVDTKSDISVSSLPKMCTVVHINQEALSNIDAELSSLGQLAEL